MKKKAASLDVYEHMLRSARRGASRALQIRFENRGDWEEFRIVDGNQCVFLWGDKTPLGEDFAYWFRFELLPLLHGLAEAVDRQKPPPKVARLRWIILEVASSLVDSRRAKPRDKSFVGLVKRMTDKRLQHEADPDLGDTVSERHVRRVLKDSERSWEDS